MSKRKLSINYVPLTNTFFMLYTMLLFITVIPLLKYVFSSILDIPFYVIELVFILSIIGSIVNIPVFTMKRERPIVAERIVMFMGVPWIVPEIEVREAKTIIAVNLGGCIIPVSLSLYIIYKLIAIYGTAMLLTILIALIVNSLLIHSVSRPIKGVGIATPAIVPPLFTAMITIFFLPPTLPAEVFFAFAYSIGTLGALIGADLMNLHKIPELGAPIASIGGAGTFDGIFLTGILSILFLI